MASYTTPGHCPDYLRFRFSGVNLGLYEFEENPSHYNVYPQKRTKSYSTILDPDPTIDPTYNKFEIEIRWKRMRRDMWDQIEPFSRKEVDGTSEDIFFWDADVGRFDGGQIKIEKLSAKVRGGVEPIDRFDVTMLIREVG